MIIKNLSNRDSFRYHDLLFGLGSFILATNLNIWHNYYNDPNKKIIFRHHQHLAKFLDIYSFYIYKIVLYRRNWIAISFYHDTRYISFVNISCRKVRTPNTSKKHRDRTFKSLCDRVLPRQRLVFAGVYLNHSTSLDLVAITFICMSRSTTIRETKGLIYYG